MSDGRGGKAASVEVCEGEGSSVCDIPGHYTWTLDDPLFRIMALRAIGWAAGEQAGRLEGL